MSLSLMLFHYTLTPMQSNKLVQHSKKSQQSSCYRQALMAKNIYFCMIIRSLIFSDADFFTEFQVLSNWAQTVDIFQPCLLFYRSYSDGTTKGLGIQKYSALYFLQILL